MTADPSPLEKALVPVGLLREVVAALESYKGENVTLCRDLRAYLTARVPDDVGEVDSHWWLFEKAIDAKDPHGELRLRLADLRRDVEAALTRQSERIRGLEAEVERLKAR